MVPFLLQQNAPRTRPLRLIAIVLVSIFLVGCHESGTWKDDSKNWKRIFGIAKPASVTVVHSWFWRSAHFTYEYEYFIQVAANDDFQKRLFTLNKLKQLTGDAEIAAVTGFSKHKPEWFLPKPVASYETWIYADEPRGHFTVLIDRETKDLFISDLQL